MTNDLPPALKFINELIEIGQQLNKSLENFMVAESLATGNTTPQIQATANDIMVKYLLKVYSDYARENKGSLEVGENWISSEHLVYLVKEGLMVNVKIEDYVKTVSRTARVGEDKKGYSPLAEKTAKEMGYTTVKEASK